MNEIFETLTSYTDTELLAFICMCVSGLFIMRICQWVYVACKWIYDWLSSMFPTSIDRK